MAAVQCFLEEEFLCDTRDSLRPGGTLIINIASRVPSIVQEAKTRVASVFDWAFSVPIEVSASFARKARRCAVTWVVGRRWEP